MHKYQWFIVFLVGTLLVEGAFLRLAYWQYNRMTFKEAQKVETLKTIQKATYIGVFDHNREVVLESQRYKNMYGYRVVTPLIIGTGATTEEILVDRGWVARQFSAHFLNQYHTQGPVKVMGVLRAFPRLKSMPYGPLQGVGAQGVRILKIFKQELVEKKHPRKKVYLQLTQIPKQRVAASFEGGGEPDKEAARESAGQSAGQSVGQLAGQSVRQIKPFFDVPQGGAKHKEYMFTWLSFACIWPVLMGAFYRRQRKRHRSAALMR